MFKSDQFFEQKYTIFHESYNIYIFDRIDLDHPLFCHIFVYLSIKQ